MQNFHSTFSFLRLRSILFVCCLIFISHGLYGQFALNGDAANIGNDCFRLTSGANWQNGSVWYLDQVDITESFDLLFQVELGCIDANGADGIAFLLQQVSTSIGSAGGGMGYQGISPSIVVELDTWQNFDENDPFYDHMSLMRNGNTNHALSNNLLGPVPISASSNNVEDCAPHEFRVTWNADSMILRAYFDCELRLQHTENFLSTTFNNDPMVFWGFTGATGGHWNVQQFCLDFISFYESLQDTSICPGTSVQLDAGAGDNYQWSPATGLNDPTIRNPIASPGTPTTYTVEVTDGCVTRFDTIFIDFRLPPANLLPDQLILCDGDSISLDASQADATYIWSDGSTDSILTVSQSGTYSVVVFTPCDTLMDTVDVIPQPVPTIVTHDALCAGEASGGLSISYNTVPPYLYLIIDNQGDTLVNMSTNNPSQTLGGLMAFTPYTLQIFDGNGCFYQSMINLSEPAPLALQLLQVQDILCGGTSTGFIEVNGNGGVAPYQYAINGGLFQNSGNFDNLAAGTYQVIVRDGNDCQDTLSLNLIENPAIVLSQGNIDSVSCQGGNDGSLSVFATGGIGQNYSYSLNGGPQQASPVFSGLSAGSYLLTVMDSLGCSAQINIQVPEPNALLLNFQIISPVDCNGNSNAVIELNGMGGVGAYQYSLQGSAFLSDSIFDNLGAGTYTAIVEDGNDCQSTIMVNITEPALLEVQQDSIMMVDCYGNATGWVDLGGVGGTTPYTFALAGSGFSTNDLIDSLSAGTYLVEVLDAHGCYDSLSITITQPDSLQAFVTQRQDVDCFGSNTGILGLSGLGGTSPYQFSLDNGVLQNTGTFDSLYAGFYQLQIVDANGCEASVDTIVSTPTGLVIGISEQQNVDCFGNDNGQLSFQAQGGLPGYQYTLDGSTFFPLNQPLQNLAPGTDTIIATDNNGCIVPIPFTITEPAPITFSLDSLHNINCFGDSTGYLELSASGGSFPYMFQINNGGFHSDSIFHMLPAGTYQIQVMDDSACMMQIDTVLTERPLLEISSDTVEMIDCWANTNGYVGLVINGGTAPYMTQMDSSLFSNALDYTNLSAGTYQFLVQDSLGCRDSLSLTLSQPDSLELNVQERFNIDCFGDSSGWIQLTAMGGTSPYMFQNGTGPLQGDSLFSNLPTGTYTFFILDENGCIDSSQISLTSPPALSLQIDTLQAVRCFGEDNGLIRLIAEGGASSYMYQLNGGPFQDNPDFTPLAPGNYSVFVQDSNLCTMELHDLLITEPDSLIAQLSGTDILCHSGRDGQLFTEISGGSPDYTIHWHDPTLPGIADLSQLPAGSYQVWVEDVLGCRDSSQWTLFQPDTLILTLDSIREAYCDWANGAAYLTTTGGIQEYRFHWSDLAGVDGPIVEDIFGGNYLVTVTDFNGCTDTLSLLVPNTPPATAIFTTFPSPDTTILLSQMPLQLINQSSGAVAYEWDLGDGTRSADFEPIVYYQEPGSYRIHLTAYNEFWECPTQYERFVEIVPDGIFYAPNAFSPNDDGYNDQFFFKGEGVQQMEAIIFDRWGAEISRFFSMNDAWDGRNQNGKPVPEGVYVYRIQGTFNSGRPFDRAGTITLIR